MKSTYPAGHILNPLYVYVPAVATDVRETIRRAREQLAQPPKSTKQQKAKEIP